ncbi:MAG: cyclase family protein, partial [Flavobacteriales bacterium]
VAEGGSVNFRDVTFNPHAHGTHTETREHIRDAFHPIDALARSGALPFLMPTLLVEAMPEPRNTAQGDDWVVPVSALETAAADVQRWAPSALIFRCTTGDVHRDWSNSNPPYLEAGFAEQLVELGIEHLLIDLPSVDREIDGGILRAHNAFFGNDPTTRTNATISELLCVPQDTSAGPGLLAMQVSPFVNDAAPSRPLWFPATVRPLS